MIRVVICDDQDVVREGLRAILGTAPGIEVVGVADDGVTAIDVISRTQPDVVLMDLQMPHLTGIQATKLIRQQYPSVHVLILTTYDADEWVLDAIRAGAAGYLLKDTPRAGLIKAIEGTVAGQTFVDPQVAGTVFASLTGTTVAYDTTLTHDLSPREREILRLLARGMSNREIAGQVSLSEGTVRNNVSQICAKLAVSDRTQAALFAVRHGLAD